MNHYNSNKNSRNANTKDSHRLAARATLITSARHFLLKIAYRPHPILIITLLAFISGTFALIYLPSITTLGIEQKTITKRLVLNQVLLAQKSPYSQTTHIITGDNIYNVMSRLNIPKNYQKLIVKQKQYDVDNKKYVLARNLRVNRTVRAFYDENGDWQSVDFYTSRKTALHIKKINNKISYEHINLPSIWEDQIGGGVINKTLFSTLNASNTPHLVVSYIVDIFGTNIDFSKDLRVGDGVYVSYKRLVVNGKVSPEVVLTGVELTVAKKDYYAFLYPSFEKYQKLIQKDSNSNTDLRYNNGNFTNIARTYYDFEGKSVIRGFLRYPLEFTRISSGFSRKRFHPILHKMRRHSGTDFAAPTNTAVRASGDGTVTFVGKKGGYGNTVIISHPKNIETRYAHLNAYAKNMRKGVSVQQNQTIGYVGKTGLATGPHLHYEFRVNSRPQDPLAVVLPKPPPLSKDKMHQFIKTRNKTLLKIEAAKISKFVLSD